MKKTLALLTLCFLPFSAHADADKSVRTIAPYLDDQAFAIVRINVAGIDVKAALQKASELGLRVGPMERFVAKQWHDNLANAGAKDAYLVWSMADRLGEPFAVIPTSGEEAARTLAGTLRMMPPLDSEAAGADVLVGSRQTLARLRKVKAASPPDLVKAFNAAGEGNIQVVIMPPPSLRRALTEVMPTLPPHLGGGSIAVVDRGIVWLAASISVSPKLSLRYVAQSRDKAAATDLRELAAKFFDSLAHSPAVKDVVPDAAGLLSVLVPKVEDGRVVLALDDQTLAKLLVPAVAQVRNSASRAQSANNVKQLLLAAINYADVYKSLPAYGSFDKDGKPLLSWRVHILPFVEQQALYQEFHLDEPWDSAHNKKLIARMPEIFRSPQSKLNDPGKATYLVPIGKQALFGGKKGLFYPRDIPDGTSNTIMLVDVNDDNAEIWTKPGGYKVDIEDPRAGLLRPMARMFMVGMADGSIHSVSRQISLQTLRAAFTRNGGEILGKDW